MTQSTLSEAFPQIAAILAENKAPLSELVALYNEACAALGHGPVTRFSDRAAANKRTRAIYEKLAGDPDARRAWGEKRLFGEQRAEDAKAFDAAPPASKAEKLKAAASEAIRVADKTPTPPVAKTSKPKKTTPVKADTPPVVLNKDDEMPVVRKGAKPLTLKPKRTIYARRAGSKQALLVDLLSRPEGATFGEIFDAMAKTDKPWRGTTIRSGLQWDINHVAGYGIETEMLNGEEFARQGRAYEARRLHVLPQTTQSGSFFGEPDDQYDPEMRLGVYRLTYPAGFSAPVPHRTKKGA